MLKQYKIFFNISPPPKELATEECIWCKEKSNKNIAHIISKGLLRTDHFSNKLYQSVCEKCNTFFGQNIEDWIFKYSPISFWINRDIKNTMKINDDKTIKYKKIFVWFHKLNEWFIALNEKSNPFPSQLICNNKFEITFFYHSGIEDLNEELNYTLLEKLINNVKRNNYSYYISDLLPTNLNSRIFEYNNSTIIISKTKDSADFFLNIIKNLKNINTIKFRNFYSDQKEYKYLIINYKWSIKKHYKLCSKIAFEFLSLIQGSNFVNNSEFNGFKKFMFEKVKNEFSEVLYINGKGINEKRLSLNGWVDVSNEAKISKKTIIPTFNLNGLENFSFSIIIYKYHSYICASIKLFEFEPCNIILSKSTQDFETIHLITYSAKEDKLLFYETTTDLESFDQDIVFVSDEKSLYHLGK
ncbi:HNH endonuclease [Chryseobacterium sp. MEBOG06]|uniref:HNH endonuclease n=1 Tax=Chryseobacterium sp. MEBOG06 TaxID=2879938 RepID=UPI001F28B1C5|nr:HNH endonuclease [Chryseobacterium sp. MEBOG06]UKB82109.1 HNH endonuclease [Chryseobacterium sp. MEBOG06]